MKIGLTTEAQRHREENKKKTEKIFWVKNRRELFRDWGQVMTVSVGGSEFLILNQESAIL